MNKSENTNLKETATRTFTPKLRNFEISMSYEGLSLKENRPESLEALKKKYTQKK